MVSKIWENTYPVLIAPATRTEEKGEEKPAPAVDVGALCWASTVFPAQKFSLMTGGLRFTFINDCLGNAIPLGELRLTNAIVDVQNWSADMSGKPHILVGDMKESARLLRLNFSVFVCSGSSLA